MPFTELRTCVRLRSPVERLYAIVGDSLDGFTDALRRHGGIQWLHVRHEEVAAPRNGLVRKSTAPLAPSKINCICMVPAKGFEPLTP
jgi:hypothetical protein